MSDPPALSARPVFSERATVLLIAVVQFVNILDFMMVMPLGPDFAAALGIPESRLGVVGGAYTAAAAVAGVAGAGVLDRFDRRTALGFSLLGLAVGTAAGGLATGIGTLLLARIVAGFFGGPATSVSFAIIADAIPPHRRGKAVGAVMTAFSVASIVGVPTGLYLAEVASWRAPFFAVAGLGLLACLWAVRLLPPLRSHLEQPQTARANTLELLSRPMVQLSYLLTALAMMGGFILIPNVSAYVQSNLHYPREGLKWLYLVGGVFSFATMRVAGRAVDRFGSFRVGLFGSSILIVIIYSVFFQYLGWPVLLAFTGFMVAMGFRNVAYNTLTTKVPLPWERARFQSFQSAIQHAASASGAFLSSQILTEVPSLGPDGQPLFGADGKLQTELAGMPTVALVSMGLAALVPLMLYVVESRVRRRDEANAVSKVDRPAPAGLHPPKP